VPLGFFVWLFFFPFSSIPAGSAVFFKRMVDFFSLPVGPLPGAFFGVCGAASHRGTCIFIEYSPPFFKAALNSVHFPPRGLRVLRNLPFPPLPSLRKRRFFFPLKKASRQLRSQVDIRTLPPPPCGGGAFPGQARVGRVSCLTDRHFPPYPTFLLGAFSCDTEPPANLPGSVWDVITFAVVTTPEAFSGFARTLRRNSARVEFFALPGVVFELESPPPPPDLHAAPCPGVFHFNLSELSVLVRPAFGRL